MLQPPTTVSDTDSEVRRRVVLRLRQMTPGEKAAIVHSLNRSCDALAVAGIKQRHPDAGDSEVRMRLGVLKVGKDLMKQAYGWDADIEGY